jgi:hypothetical protein
LFLRGARCADGGTGGGSRGGDIMACTVRD